MLQLCAERAEAQRTFGIDVSSYQGQPNWTSVKNSGVVFAWAKATEGTGITDADFVYNANNGKAAGVYIGAYHFAHPNLNTPGAEANAFWSVAGNYIRADGLTLMPMLDMEVFSGVVGASSYSDWANQWCNAIVAKAAAQGVSVTPVIYVSACNACNFNSSVAQWIPWIADYNGQDPNTGTPWSVCGGCAVWGSGVWDVWQYSDCRSVSGISGCVDADVFNGNSSQLVADLVATGTFNPHINPTLALNSDGRQEIFAVGHSGNLYHNYQTVANGGWSGWISLGGTWAQNGQPKVLRNADGRLEVFIIGTDGRLNHAWETTTGNSSSWTGWSQFSSLLTQQIKIGGGVNANGALDIFVVGTDGVLYEMHQTSPGGAWSGWANFGGSWIQDVDIANGNDADGRQEVMLIGNTGNLYSKFQTSVNGGWSGWQNHGGSFGQNYRIALGRNSDGRLEVFVIDAPSTALFHRWQTSANGGWSGWATLAGSWEADAKPVVAADQNGALEVLLIGHTGNLYHNYQTGGGWSGWLNLNGTFTQNIRPIVGPNQDGRLEWYSTGQGTDMVHIWETAPNSTSWSGYFSLGGSWN
jgi:GH25 family lysozyme M1 (1,4-beta-N-acetylmuramidase)